MGNTTGRHYETSVFPVDRASAVVYPGCEVDEVDSHGALRIGRQNSSNSAGQDTEYDYVVWAPGTWQRAETVQRCAGGATTVDDTQDGQRECAP